MLHFDQELIVLLRHGHRSGKAGRPDIWQGNILINNILRRAIQSCRWDDTAGVRLTCNRIADDEVARCLIRRR
jgi:hypothetical protein